MVNFEEIGVQERRNLIDEDGSGELKGESKC